MPASMKKRGIQDLDSSWLQLGWMGWAGVAVVYVGTQTCTGLVELLEFIATDPAARTNARTYFVLALQVPWVFLGMVGVFTLASLFREPSPGTWDRPAQ